MAYSGLEKFFTAETVAVIGASRTAGKIGYEIMQNMCCGKFAGNIIPVNPKAEQILGEKCYQSIKKIPGQVDLAIVCVKAEEAVKVYQGCCERKVPAVVMISSGFGEIGNVELTKKLEGLIKKYPKTRLVGPNCLGVLNAVGGIDTLFLPGYRQGRPKPGNISFISQSGALGSAVLDWAAMMNYGVAKFVSYGNAMGVKEADLIDYLGEDDETKVIAVYVEGVVNGRNFFEALKRNSKKKPIIVLKGGVTNEGSKAASSHTASLAGDSAVFEAALKQSGAIKVDTLTELFDCARALAKLPKPRGNKVQIITDGGGYGVLTADWVAKYGLLLSKMDKKNLDVIKKVVPPHVVLSNPMDLTGDVNNMRYRVAVENALADKNVDMLIVILLYQVPTLTSEIVETIAELYFKWKKPMVVISVGGEFSEVHKKALEKEGVVNFTYPENAVRALKALYDYWKMHG